MKYSPKIIGAILFISLIIASPAITSASTFNFLSPLDNPSVIASDSASIRVELPATSSQISSVKLISGLPNGGFESGLNGWTITSSGNWTLDSSTKHSGASSAKTIVDNSSISKLISVLATTSISFYWETSFGSSLTFSDNSQNVASLGKSIELGGGWRKVEKVLSPGSHNLVWSWKKGNINFGTPAGYLDDVTLDGVVSTEQALTWESDATDTAIYLINLSGLPDGPTNFIIKANISGLDTESDTRAIIVNQSVPAIQIAGIPATYCVDTSVNLGAIGSGDVAYYKYNIDGGAWSGAIELSQTTPVSNLASGSHTVQMLAGDTSGNWQITPTTKSWTISVPPALPVATVVTVGGGGGGGGASVSAMVSSLVPSVPTVAPSAVPGRVLGVSAFRFENNLKQGMGGSDVVELQKILKSQKFLKQLTSYYGSATTLAVKAFQRKNKIKPVNGQVGPLTRIALNKLLK